MKGLLSLIFLLGFAACASSQTPAPVSVANPPEVVCLEKTTRKECYTNKSGKEICSCVPDDGEMLSYP